MNGRVINLAALRASTAYANPFWWAVQPAVFTSPNIGRVLQSSFPVHGFSRFRRLEGPKQHDLCGRRLLPPDQDTDLHPIWQRLSAELHGASYRDALFALSQIDLSGLEIEITLWRQGLDGVVDPHVDNSAKRLINLIYLSDSDWSTDEGGCLRILRSYDIDDVEAEILPHAGTSVVFVRSEQSWHGYKPITATSRQRLVVQVAFHTGDLAYGRPR